jgi:hypothetical protein
MDLTPGVSPVLGCSVRKPNIMEVVVGVSTTDYSTLSKDELAHEMGEVFGKARGYVERGDAIPKDIWFSISQTVGGLCQRVGIDTPEQLVGFPSGN